MTEILKTKPLDLKSVALTFEEAKQAAWNYITRGQRTQEQAEYIIATVYTNLKMSIQTAETVSILKWMDTEILRLNAIKTGSLNNETSTELDIPTTG